MSNYVLVMREHEADVGRFAVGVGGLLIGRASEADVILLDSMVSRRHALVWLDSGQLMAEDLGSRNGILVNGLRVQRSALKEGDTLTVGGHTFVIARFEGATTLADTGSMISFEKAGELCEQMVSEEGTGQLRILYKAAQLLGTVFNLDELLKRILDLVFEALPARRGYILTLSPEAKEPVVRASLSREEKVEGPPVSFTLIEHVFTLRNAVLTVNAQQDERFGGADSIVSHEIRAAMCVPMCGRDAIAGAIYVDSGHDSAVFTYDHLKLLTAIGRVVGVAVENARLYQYAVERERLAAIGQATAGLGHCIKNILTGILGGSELIDDALVRQEWPRLRKGWSVIRHGIERIETVVLNLLTFSRDRQPDWTPSDINEILREVMEVVRSRAEKLNVKTELREGNVPSMLADGRQLYRAFLNLVTNAVDACEETGGTVTVTTSSDVKGCYVRVRDTGVGIQPDLMPKLFHAFNSTKGSRGTGLGLACSEKIVREHAGKITVQSQPGKGSEFTVYLPMQTVPGVPNQASELPEGQ